MAFLSLSRDWKVEVQSLSYTIDVLVGATFYCPWWYHVLLPAHMSMKR
jgi:hypothetical protein